MGRDGVTGGEQPGRPSSGRRRRWVFGVLTNSVLADPPRRRLAGRLGQEEKPPQGRVDLGDGKRLADEHDPPEGNRLEQTRVISLSARPEDDRYRPAIGQFSQGLAQPKPVEMGHVHVRYHGIGAVADDGVERVATVTGEDNVEAAALEHQTEHGQGVDTILGHDDQGSRVINACGNDGDAGSFDRPELNGSGKGALGILAIRPRQSRSAAVRTRPGRERPDCLAAGLLTERLSFAGKQRRWRLRKGRNCLCSRDYTGSVSSPPRKRSSFPTPPARDVVALVVVVLAIVFILQNRGTTTIRFLIPDISAPLWTALLISSLLGVALGMAISHRRRRPPMG